MKGVKYGEAQLKQRKRQDDSTQIWIKWTKREMSVIKNMLVELNDNKTKDAFLSGANIKKLQIIQSLEKELVSFKVIRLRHQEQNFFSRLGYLMQRFLSPTVFILRQNFKEQCFPTC